MKLGRVVGTVVSTISHPFFDARRLLLCDLVDDHGEEADGYLICVDAVDAGFGETVLILDEGNGARQVFHQTVAPIRSVVVGIVDELWVDGDVVEV